MTSPPAPADLRTAPGSALAAADADHQELTERLLGLEDHRGAAWLQSHHIVGVTARHWERCRTERAGAFADLEAHRVTCEDARERLAGRGRLTRSARAEVLTLLSGAGGTLTLKGDPIARRELADRVRRTADLVETLLDEVVAAVAVLSPLVGTCEAGVRAAEAAAARLGDRATADACRELRARADALRAVADRDPLSSVADGAVDRTPHDALRRDAAATAHRLTIRADVRRGAAGRLDEVARCLEALVELERRATLVLAEVALKIVDPDPDPDDGPAPPVPTGPTTLPGLRRELDHARRLLAASAWEELVTVVPHLEAGARRTIAAARAGIDARRRPLRSRDVLRGRLEAYRVKALDGGLAEHDDLARLHWHAHDLLWHWPCDLGAARAAGERYAAGVNRRLRGEPT